MTPRFSSDAPVSLLAAKICRRLDRRVTGSAAALRRRYMLAGAAVEIHPSATISPTAIIDVGNERGEQIVLGAHSFVMHGAMLLTYGGRIELGEDCTVNPYSILYGHGGLTIGNHVRIAAHCVLIPAKHNFADPNQPIRSQGQSAQGILIEDDVWIGSRATVLDGCRIGMGSVIGSGAVVTRDIEPYTVAVGVPARPIGRRG